MRKLTFLLACLFLVGVGLVQAQSKSISGKVLSADDGQPIIGASVMVKGTSVGTVTNLDGYFKISLQGDATNLLISYVGMLPANVVAKNNMIVKLLTDELLIDEVVVIGYGSAKKVGTVVGSVSKVSAEKLKDKPVANILDALQGKVAGLQVLTSNGEPSAISSMRLHGTGSLGAGSAPLYVLDGAPVSVEATLSLNSNDIESMTVLKDASATSIYGTRASNGVIYITTKRGNGSGKSVITVKAQYGVSKQINSEFFDQIMTAKQLTDFWVATGYQTQAQVDATLAQFPNNTRWDKVYNKEEALNYQGDVSISGGTDKTRYYVSSSYLFQDGLAYRSEFDRYTLRSNIDSKVNNWLSVGVNISGGYDKRAANQYSGANLNRGLAMLAPPFYTPYDKDGNKIDGLIPGTTRYTPWYLQAKMPYSEATLQLNGVGYIQINPIKGLIVKIQGAVDAYGKSINTTRLPSYIGSLNNGSVTETARTNVTKTFTHTAEYKFDINKIHNFTALAGYEWIENAYKNVYGITTAQTDDRLILLSNGTTGKDATSAKSEYAFQSYFGRLDYSLNDKYYADFSVRQDGSSRFGMNKQTATFVAAGAMWDAKKENFLKNLDFLSSLRIKASVGTGGNADIPEYQHLATVGTGAYDGQTAWFLSAAGNPDLQWETQIKSTFGVKFSLFDDAYRFNVEYYSRNVSNMLMNVPYPYTAGYSSILCNTGDMQNKGVDFSFEFDLLKAKDYHVTPYVNLNYNKEKITDLFQNRNFWIIPNTGVCYVVDQPVTFFYPIFAGVDQADGLPMWYVPGADITKTTKETTTKTFNSAALQQNTGIKRSSPINGGFGLSAGFKGISLQADFAFSIDKSLINNDRYFYENPNQFAGMNQSSTVLDYWKKPGDVARFPKYGTQFTQFDSRLIEDASFMRLKNLTIGYNLPEKLLHATNFFTNVKFFGTARNLMTFTSYSGPDPEADSNLALGLNPNTKQFSIGCEISF